MAKRRHYHKQKFKIKLKKNTVYSIFALFIVLSGILLGLSFTRSGNSFVSLNDYLVNYFGILALLFPLFLIILGFFFLRLKIFLSRPNVSVGFLILFLSLLGTTHEGSLGLYLNKLLAELISGLGAFFVYLAGVFIGLVVLFDTSFDEITAKLGSIFGVFQKILPGSALGFFKKKPSALEDKQMVIKGMIDKNLSKDMKINTSAPVVTEEKPFISDKLVMTKPGEIGMWHLPPLDLLSSDESQKADRGDVKDIAHKIEETLASFNIKAKVVEANQGPAVTQYALEIPSGTKVSKITNLANNLALSTEAPTGQIRIEAPIPGRNLVGLEIPNRSLQIVNLRTMLSSDVMKKNKSKLAVSLGLDVSGNPLIADLGKMPHVLIAGTTGSGKSVMINSFITSLLFRATPDEVRLIMIDPKRVELTGYNGIPHLMTPVIVEVDQILKSLKWAMSEMDKRYKLFAEHGVRNIDSYNELAGFQTLPYIVIFVDELATLMGYAPVEVEDAIARLAQMARATGIHLVVATQRPSVDVITGLIKANIPCRIAFNVSSMIDSRVILDTPGAEKLLGRGDMLYIPPEQSKPSRIQGAFVSDKEVRRVVEFLKNENPPAQYNTEEVLSDQLLVFKKGASQGAGGRDELFNEAVRTIVQHNTASASFLQRRLGIGFSRAGRLLDQLEEVGAVGRPEGSKPRDVLIRDPEEFLASLGDLNASLKNMTTAGEKLKAARLEKGLTLEDVSKNTKIRVSFLEYIENGEYQKLPSVSYAQGFVNNYVKFLGVDEEETMAIFRREFTGEKSFRVLPKGMDREQEFETNRFKLKSTIVLIIAVFILFFAYILFQYRGAFINPSLVITTPKQNAQVFSSQLKIEGKTDADATIYIDKNEVTVDQNGHFSKTINVFPGLTTIDVKSMNKFQRQTEKKIEVNIRGQ